jgi:hypothetical protein
LLHVIGIGRRGPSRFGRPLAVLASLVLGAVVVAGTAQPTVALAGDGTATVSPALLRELATRGSTGFVVYLRDRAKLDTAARLRDSNARTGEVYRQLTSTAEHSQRGLKAALNKRKVSYDAFWIANALHVKGDKALVESIAARPEVERIEPDRSYQQVKPQPATQAARMAATGPEWGLTTTPRW